MRRARRLLTVAGLAAFFLGQNPAEAIASCPAANPNDSLSDDVAINACLAGGGTITLTSGTPGYIIQSSLQMGSSVVLDGGPTGARLIAHASLVGPILRIGIDSAYNPISPEPSNFTVKRVLFDGNRSVRPLSVCTTYQNGTNAMIKGNNFTVDQIYSFLAVCGTGLEIQGSSYQLTNSVFNSNHGDGLSIRTCTNSAITDNVLWDNDDVGLIVGDGTGYCNVLRNTISNYTIAAHAGLMAGFHSGAVIHNNTIFSNLNLMKVGLMIGGHIWNGGAFTFGAGDIQYNHVDGAVVLGAIDGISSGYFWNNTAGTRQGTAFFSNCPTWNDIYIVNTSHIGTATVQPGYTVRNLDSCFPPP